MSNDVMTLTRARLFVKEPFWASLASNLELIQDPNHPTGSTDGRVLRYNPEFLEKLPIGQRQTFLAHETCHCALGHPWRLGERDPQVANEAADYTVNEILEKAGFEPIPCWLRDPQYDGMTFEQIYSSLMAKRQQGGGKQGQPGQQQQGGSQSGQGQGQTSPGSGQTKAQGTSTGKGEGSGTGQPGPGQAGAGSGATGDFTAAPKELEQAASGEPGGMSEGDWQMAVEQAMAVSRAAGTLPGALAAAVQQGKRPKVDWVAELREFVTHSLPSELSWTTPNRRYIWQGLYLPGVSKENTGRGILAIDCSGSTMPYQKMFASEFKGIIREARPEELTVIYWDAKSSIPESDVERVTPDDLEVDMKPRGFGGTVFQPVLDYVEKNQLDPAFMIVLTDLYFTHPKQPTPYPVMWAVPDYCKGARPTFGQVIEIPKED